MNTTKKGDLFEEKCSNVIKGALKNGELGIIPSICKIYTKKKYFSFEREGDIIFDISIEVTPKGAKKPTLVYVIECKDLNKKVPVDDVEEFQSKISGLRGFQVKGVIISNGSLQKSGYNIANNRGYMLIEVNENGYNIVLHKKTKNKFEIDDEVILKIKEKLYESFLVKSISGLKKLSKEGINKISKNIINEFLKKSDSKNYNLINFKVYLEKFHNLKFELLPDSSIELGQFIPSENKILINKAIINTNQYNFVLYHEIAHYFLHRKIEINKNIYDLFSDAEFSYIDKKFILENPKNWIEWQANYLAGCLALPEEDILREIVLWQVNNSIRNKGTIFLDKQKVNIEDFKNLSNYLSSCFKISKTVIKYRLLDLKVLTIAQSFYDLFKSDLKCNYPYDSIEEVRRKSIERAKELYGF